jgi:hypothetical protein
MPTADSDLALLLLLLLLLPHPAAAAGALQLLLFGLICLQGVLGCRWRVEGLPAGYLGSLELGCAQSVPVKGIKGKKVV